MKNIISSFINFMKNGYIGFAMGMPLLVGIIFVFIWFLIFNGIYDGNIPQNISAIGLASLGFFVGLSGIVQILRRELPGFTFDKPFRGIMPIISGILITLMFWSLTLLGLYYGFNH